MLHAGLDLSRRKVDVRLLNEDGEHLHQLAVPPDSDSLRAPARRNDEVHGGPVFPNHDLVRGSPPVHAYSLATRAFSSAYFSSAETVSVARYWVALGFGVTVASA